MDTRLTDIINTVDKLITLAKCYTEAEDVLDELVLDTRISFNTLQEELGKVEQLDPNKLRDAIIYHALYGYMNKTTCLLSKCALHYPASVKEEFPFGKMKEPKDGGVKPPDWDWTNV